MTTRINNADDFINVISGIADGTTAGEQPEKVLRCRFGIIDPAYTSGAPKVKFDGESTVSARTYKRFAHYTPVAGDRVMIFEGVIMGKIV